MSRLADRLKNDLKKSKEYRHGYADEFLNEYIATQIKVLREQRGWTQERLAEEAEMKQSRISVLENVNYSSWSLSTLKRLAEAFDVSLRVSYESFGSRLLEIDQFSRASLERFSFDEDPAFWVQSIGKTEQGSALEALKGYEQPQGIDSRGTNNMSEKGTIVNLFEYKAMKQQSLDGALQKESKEKTSALQAATL
ncbi:MAG: helix-turn-helix transcriptional regulator [Nitrospira sp.]|nr:helix-turn-helix transcriptional regulator [Nitrospira sp.]MBS1813234.1 helix-turn-helix transcriptional regulator [Acidobacteriota bacterium]